MDNMSSTFFAALRSVGTAGTMAAAGFYLHRRKFISASDKKALARMSQQVTIPALFFAKFIYCPQDSKPQDSKCPNITDSLADIWVLLFWPLFVVGCGLVVGELACRLSSTPRWQRKSVLAACAFANSTGIPITLLTVIHSNFPATSEIGRVDPNLFLSVYLVLYPVMQWGIGGWLLASGEDSTDTPMGSKKAHDGSDDVLYAEAASNVIRELSLSELLETPRRKQTDNDAEDARLLPPQESVPPVALSDVSDDVAPLTEMVVKALPKAFQPPVIGALLGLLIASIVPLRGIFVDLHGRADGAPLEWLFDGLYLIGQAAIPINMCILGINLSITSQIKPSTKTLVSTKTVAAMVIGKMVVMPLIGILSAIILKNYIWDIPDAIDGPFYLVIMIVTITPTANNVMVMVELTDGEATKEGMARMIFVQYMVAPIILSATVMLVVLVAGMW